MTDEIAALRARLEAAEALHEPIPDTYACQACGRRDGLDAVIPSPIWEQISDGLNLLCLWCIDRRCRDAGIEVRASLHFAGLAVSGTSDSDATQEHVSRLVQQRIAAEARSVRLAEALRPVLAYLDALECLSVPGDRLAWIVGVTLTRSDLRALRAALAEHDAAAPSPKAADE